jgi:hypothetical protein
MTVKVNCSVSSAAMKMKCVSVFLVYGSFRQTDGTKIDAKIES